MGIAKLKANLLIFSILGFFGALYAYMIMRLPLFGDATIHGFNANHVLNSGWKDLQADYPSHYSYLMAQMGALMGEDGYKVVIVAGFIFLCLSGFLLVRHFTRSSMLGALAIVLIACSPKLIFYSARMYQEILITAIFIYAIYVLFRFMEAKSKLWLTVLIVAIGTALSIKQQGLFILYPTIIAFFLIMLFRHRLTLRIFAQIALIPLAICAGYYGLLFHNMGTIQPGSDEILPLRIVNQVGQTVFGYTPKPTPETEPTYELPSNSELNKKLNKVVEDRSEQAHAKAETRHIWPWEPFTSFKKFNQANSLYVDFQGKPLESPFIMYICFVGIVLGVLLTIKGRKHNDLLIFTLIFVTVNYILFARNTDQQRYQLFLAIFLLTFIFIFLGRVARNLGSGFWRKTLVIIGAIILLVPIVGPRYVANQRWGGSQLYSSSIGGIASVAEAGSWIRQHTSPHDHILQQCGNEIQYYSDREVLGDWRVYFLSPAELREYFRRNDISYYIIFRSQIVPDSAWSTACWIPESFVNQMEANFAKTYVTSKNDIYIYRTGL